MSDVIYEYINNSLTTIIFLFNQPTTTTHFSGTLQMILAFIAMVLLLGYMAESRGGLATMMLVICLMTVFYGYGGWAYIKMGNTKNVYEEGLKLPNQLRYIIIDEGRDLDRLDVVIWLRKQRSSVSSDDYLKLVNRASKEFRIPFSSFFDDSEIKE